MEDLPQFSANGANATAAGRTRLSDRLSGPAYRPLVGATLIVLAELMFAAMGATVRHLSTALGNESLVFFRNAVGLLLLAPFLLGGPRCLGTRVLHLHILRGLSGLAAMYCFYYALARMPLAEAMLLKLSAPLFIPLIALVWLGESLRLVIAGAVLIGFLGVAIILAPSLETIAPVALVALMGGGFAALAKVTVRRLGRTEPARRTVFYFALIATGVSSVPMLWNGSIPGMQWWPWIIALGVLATLGQLLLTRGFALSPAGQLAPFTYFSVVFAAVIGWLLWEETLGWSTVTGSVLVIVAGILTARLGTKRTGERPASAGAEALAFAGERWRPL